MEQALETPDYRMEILLGLKGFRIKQIDNIRACMGLVIDYDFLIDVTKNPAQWVVCFKDGTDYRKVKLSDGVVPGIARTNAVTLIAAYQEAMVDRALDIEKPRRNGTYKPKDKPSAQPAPSLEPAQAQPKPDIGQAEEAKELLLRVAIEEMADRIHILENSQAGPQEQIIRNVSQAKVTITKNSKGYNWEISAYADTINESIDLAIAADKRLKNQFGGVD